MPHFISEVLFVTPSEFWANSTPDQKNELADKAKTTYANLQQVCRGGSCGKVLAAKLASAAKGMGIAMTELEILYPERYEQSAA